MNNLDPTYLRYIYDGLIKGSVHPENESELPDGLIGLYEEAFDEHLPVVQRQQMLIRFALFALLKKEVSAAFAAEVLDENEDEIQNFISNYSVWFNSQESGKYQLYQERLKVYLLQKFSEGEINAIHEKLIIRLEQAISDQKADEFEWYGLEFLGRHYTIQSKTTNEYKDAKEIFNLFYKFQTSKTILTRQKDLTNSYKWSKINITYLSELAIFFKSKKIFNISDLACEIHNDEYNIIERLEKLIDEGNFHLAIILVAELQEYELELIELKVYHLLLLIVLIDNEGYIKDIVLILKNLLSKHAGEELFYLEHLVPSSLILTICIKIQGIGESSDFIIQSCDNWKESGYYFEPQYNLNEERQKLVEKKISSIKTLNDFELNQDFSIDLFTDLICNGQNLIKSEIRKRNIDFYSYDVNLDKKEYFTENDNFFQSLEFIASSQNYQSESETFYFLVKHLDNFNCIHAYSLLNSFKSLNNQHLKDILISKYWEILILDIDLIDMVFEVSNTISINKLFSISLYELHEIISITQSQKILDACKIIIDIKTQKNLPESFDVTFCSSFDISFEFKFNCLDTILNQEQINQYYQLKTNYFIQLFESNIETDILNYNIPFIQELVVFCKFCKQFRVELIDELLTCYVYNLQHYDKYQFDENLFFLIDEMNKKNLSLEAYKILVLMKTQLLLKVSLIKSFSKYAFLNNMTTSFTHESLLFIEKDHRKYIILGWLEVDYGSKSYDLNVGNDLPKLPNSIFCKDLFFENLLFVIERPDVLKLFAIKIIENESNPESLKSFFPFLFETYFN